MKEAPDPKLGGAIVTSTTGLSEVVEKGSMGLTGIWYTLTNVSCVVVICYMVLVQQPAQFASQQDRTDRLVEKIQVSHERNTDRLAAAIDKLSERIGRGRGAVGEFEEANK